MCVCVCAQAEIDGVRARLLKVGSMLMFHFQHQAVTYVVDF